MWTTYPKSHKLQRLSEIIYYIFKKIEELNFLEFDIIFEIMAIVEKNLVAINELFTRFKSCLFVIKSEY